MKKFTLLFFLLMAGIIHAQTFTEVSTGIMPMFFASADFADYDNDGDQDLAIIGVDADFNDQAEIYRNDNGIFTPINADISPMHMGAVSWIDYDTDGDYDLFCSGQDYSMNTFATIYENNGGTFTPSGVTIPAGFWNSCGWGDYDNDGDPDLAYSWYSAGVANSAIFRNDNGSFMNINAGLPGLTEGSMEWGDYDGDGDLDLLHTGTPADFTNTLVLIYQNNNGVFTDIQAGFMDCAWYNNAEWNDIDNDGDLDVVYVGDDGSEYPFVVYFNTDGVFELSNTGLFGVRTSNGNIGMQTGDIDNDGDMDVVMTGDDPSYSKSTKIFLNDNGTFTALQHSIPGFGSGTLDLSDIDNDGDLDLFFVGYDNSSTADVAIFINDANSNTYSTNMAPSAPSGLLAEVTDQHVQLTWNMSTDDHTPQTSLQYNIYIGTASGTADIVCAQSIIDPVAAGTGFHFMPKPGNSGMQLQFSIDGLPNGIYYWSVQAIDQSGAASEFAAEQTFDVGNVSGVVETESNLNLWPNPATSSISLPNIPDPNALIQCIDMSGKVIFTRQNNPVNSTIDVSELNPGQYFLRISSAGHILISKFQKIK